MKKFLLNKLIQEASKAISPSGSVFQGICDRLKKALKMTINKSRVQYEIRQAIKEFKESMKNTRTLKEAKFNAHTLSNEISAIAKNATFDVKINGKVILMYQNGKLRINFKGIESLFFELFTIATEGLMDKIISFIFESLSTSFNKFKTVPTTVAA